MANSLGLTRDVLEEARTIIPLQPLVDQGPEDDLKTDRKLQDDRRLPRNDPDRVQEPLGEDEENSGSVR